MSLREEKSKDKSKDIAKVFPNKLDGKRCFNYQECGHFKADCSNRRDLTISEIKEIDQIHIETIEEEEELETKATIPPPDVEEMLVLRRIMHGMKGP